MPRPSASIKRSIPLKGASRVDFANPLFHTAQYSESFVCLKQETDREHIALDRVYQVNTGRNKPRRTVQCII
jgi:hypothetical protein